MSQSDEEFTLVIDKKPDDDPKLLLPPSPSNITHVVNEIKKKKERAIEYIKLQNFNYLESL